MRPALLTCLLVACGSTPPPIAPQPPAELAPPPFASHGPLTLRTDADAAPPFHVEMAADGSITGTRCGATRFTGDGVLEREGLVVARLVERDGAFTVLAGDRETGWLVRDESLVASGGARFSLDGGVVSASVPNAPAVSVDPPDAPAHLVLGVFAVLLVCDDRGP